ncbi:MAG: hypothetical protein ABIO68_06035 [Sphingomicrobium sp.]
MSADHDGCEPYSPVRRWVQMSIPSSLDLPDASSSLGITLGAQLAIAALLVIVTVVIHGGGIVAVTRLLNLESHELRARRVNVRAFGLMISMALLLFALHVAEIAVFAIFYMAVGAVHHLEPALYYSASTYATLGQPSFPFPENWRIVAALEGLVGFLMIGWSTAVFINDMNKVLREEIDG